MNSVFGGLIENFAEYSKQMNFQDTSKQLILKFKTFTRLVFSAQILKKQDRSIKKEHHKQGVKKVSLLSGFGIPLP